MLRSRQEKTALTVLSVSRGEGEPCCPLSEGHGSEALPRGSGVPTGARGSSEFGLCCKAAGDLGRLGGLSKTGWPHQQAGWPSPPGGAWLVARSAAPECLWVSVGCRVQLRGGPGSASVTGALFRGCGSVFAGDTDV